jgi:hypothetical protein
LGRGLALWNVGGDPIDRVSQLADHAEAMVIVSDAG